MFCKRTFRTLWLSRPTYKRPEIEDRPIDLLRESSPYNAVSQILEIWIIPDISKLAGPEKTFEYSRHVHIEEWARFSESKQDDRVPYVLADTRQGPDLIKATGEFATS